MQSVHSGQLCVFLTFITNKSDESQCFDLKNHQGFCCISHWLVLVCALPGAGAVAHFRLTLSVIFHTMWVLVLSVYPLCVCVSLSVLKTSVCVCVHTLCRLRKHCVLLSLSSSAEQNPNRQQEIRQAWSPITTTVTSERTPCIPAARKWAN